MTNIYSAPVCDLSELTDLFIELTAKNCNQRCKHCYIDFPLNRVVKDFISVDKIKDMLNDTTHSPVQTIYLTGAEPMTHPDFNAILRLCLKRANVCIMTNATFINDKKARFLKKVEEEGSNEIIFRLSLDHYDEIKNDDIRWRGAYRQVVFAIKSLVKYGFNPIISACNYYNDSTLHENLLSLCHKIGYNATSEHIKVINYIRNDIEINNIEFIAPDCINSRTLTAKGVYVCPLLANDHRGRMGCDFKNYSSKMYLETSYCYNCLSNKQKLFTIDYSVFS